jgi:hypothetical protein
MQGIYRLAVRMTMENEVSPVMRLIAHDLLPATMQIGRFRVALGAAGAAWIGKTIIADLKHIIDHGGELGSGRLQPRRPGRADEDGDHRPHARAACDASRRA